MRECEEYKKNIQIRANTATTGSVDYIHNSCIGHQEFSTKEQGSKESVSVSFLLTFPIRLQLLLSTVPISKVPI